MRSCIEARARALTEEEPATPTHARRSCMYEAVLEQAQRLGLSDIDPSSLVFEPSDFAATRAVVELRRETSLERQDEALARKRSEASSVGTDGTQRTEWGMSGQSEQYYGASATEASESQRVESNGTEPAERSGPQGTETEEAPAKAAEADPRPGPRLGRISSRGALKVSPLVRHDILELPSGFSGVPAGKGRNELSAELVRDVTPTKQTGDRTSDDGEASGRRDRAAVLGDTVPSESRRRELNRMNVESQVEIVSTERPANGHRPRGSTELAEIEALQSPSVIVRAEKERNGKPVDAGGPYLEHAGSQTEGSTWAAESSEGSGTESSVGWQSPGRSVFSGGVRREESGSSFGGDPRGESSTRPIRLTSLSSEGTSASPIAVDFGISPGRLVAARLDRITGTEVPARTLSDSPSISKELLEDSLCSASQYGPSDLPGRRPPVAPGPATQREATGKGSPTESNKSSSFLASVFSPAADFLRKHTPRAESSPRGAEPSPLGGSPRGSASSRSGTSVQSSPRTDPESPNRGSYLAGKRGIQQLRELRKSQEKSAAAVLLTPTGLSPPGKPLPRRNSEPLLSRLSTDLGNAIADVIGARTPDPQPQRSTRKLSSYVEGGSTKHSPRELNGAHAPPHKRTSNASPSEGKDSPGGRARPVVKPLNLRALAEESAARWERGSPLIGLSERTPGRSDKTPEDSSYSDRAPEQSDRVPRHSDASPAPSDAAPLLTDGTPGHSEKTPRSARQSAAGDSYMDSLLERERRKEEKKATTPRPGPLFVSVFLVVNDSCVLFSLKRWAEHSLHALGWGLFPRCSRF